MIFKFLDKFIQNFLFSIFVLIFHHIIIAVPVVSHTASEKCLTDIWRLQAALVSWNILDLRSEELGDSLEALVSMLSWSHPACCQWDYLPDFPTSE